MDGTLNILKLAKYFSDEDAARELLEEMRWGKSGAVCPRCGGADPYKLTPKATSKKPGRKGLYKCRACRKQFTVTVGTVFEASHIPLSKWLLAIHLLASSKKGISAHQLHRNLGISYKGAWFMAHRLRYAMQQGPLTELLSGTVEADETYIGGSRRGRADAKRGRPTQDSNKTPVMGLVERGGRLRAKPIERVTAKNITGAIFKDVNVWDSHLMTDEGRHYDRIGRKFKSHQTVKHTSGEYVRGKAHTNTIEGFFGILKRGINGVYHHVGRGHLSRYCDEFAFRYNTRTALGYSDGQRAAEMVAGAEGKRLTYKQPA